MAVRSRVGPKPFSEYTADELLASIKAVNDAAAPKETLRGLSADFIAIDEFTELDDDDVSKV